jgi:hypothetical protein
LWEHHKRNYNPKHDTPTEPTADKKKGNVIIVKTDTTGKKKKKKNPV